VGKGILAGVTSASATPFTPAGARLGAGRHVLSLFIALLFLTLPALAQAWTLTIKVTGPGGVPDNKVVVSGGASKTVTSGTFTLYPSGSATITVFSAAGYSRSVVVDGVASASSAFTFSAGSHNVTVNYSAPSTNSVAITQQPGGAIQLQLANGTWSSTGASGVLPGTVFPVSIAANADYTIASYTINGVTTPYNGTLPGQVLQLFLTVSATPTPNTVTASFILTPVVTATLAAPTVGYTTQNIVVSAVASSNDTGLSYLFGVIDKPAGAPPIATQGPGPLQSYSFVPVQEGIYRLQVTVTSEHGGSATATADVVVTSYLDYLNAQCTSCHSISYPAVVQAYSAGSHPLRGVGCMDCHTSDAPHTNGINSDNVSSVTFQVTGPVQGYQTGALFCMSAGCHTPGVAHRSPGLTCAACHASGELHNPDASFAASSNLCFNCHGQANSTHFYTKGLPLALCASCHPASGHDPIPAPAVSRAHFNGYASYADPGYRAAYVTPATLCADCHQGGDPGSAADAALASYRSQWQGSGHGAVDSRAFMNSASDNWKGSGTAGARAKSSAGIARDCQRCHSAAGYLRFALYSSIAPLSTGQEPYSEPLACNACHASGDFSGVRALAARTGYYNYSSALTGRLEVSLPYPDSGRSNLCLGCHVGRGAGATIQAMAQATAQQSYSSSFWRDTGFVDSHHLAAGGQLFGLTGYHYPGVPYLNGAVDHALVGLAAGQGGCVACHMPGSSHTLESSAAGYALCNDCHSGAGTVGAGFLAERGAGFRAALKALAAALSAKGFAPELDAQGTPIYPYFSARDWGGRESAPGNMGAAFNFNLLSHDPGAFAHNPTYVKRLVRDSIDYLSFGGVQRGRDLSPTVQLLLADPTERAAAAAFLARAADGSAACAVCHGETLDPRSGENILAAYGASKHASSPEGALCVSCHAPAAATAHPQGALLSGVQEISERCFACHPAHPWPSLGRCGVCHNGHNPEQVTLGYPHYANFSSAQYVTTRISCDNCHTTVDILGDLSFQVYSANMQWGRSGKGDIASRSWNEHDFKTLGSPAPASPANSAAPDCVRCHTTTGYQSYVGSGFQDISAWGSSGLAAGGDRTREMVACSACHDPTPFRSYYQYDWDTDIDTPPFSRRKVAQVTFYYNLTTAGVGRILNPVATPGDAGESNNCIACHGGKVAGSTLKALSQKAGPAHPFWNDTPFIDPHGMAAAGVLYGKSGYTFPGVSYTSPFSFVHWALGGSDSGPCVVCHMLTPKPHLFAPLSKGEDGRITEISGFEAVCGECHSGGSIALDVAAMNRYRDGYLSSLRALAAVLAARGIHFNPELAPFFFRTAERQEQGEATAYRNWGALYQPGSPPLYRSADLMGAAFNLRLLWSERGAYAHNDYYAKRLVYDSIDLADDGRISSSVYLTIQNLEPGDDLSVTDKENALQYLGTRP